MNRLSFCALIRQDLHAICPRQRYSLILALAFLIECAWLLALVILSPLALGDSASIFAPTPFVLLILLPALSMSPWREEVQNGSILLTLSAPLSSPFLALARFLALLIASLPLAFVPLFFLPSLSLLTALDAGAIAAAILASIYIAALIALFASLMALLFRRGPFALILPLPLVLGLGLLDRLFSRSDIYLRVSSVFSPLRYWDDFMTGHISWASLFYLSILALLTLGLEALIVEKIRRRGWN